MNCLELFIDEYIVDPSSVPFIVLKAIEGAPLGVFSIFIIRVCHLI
jgi:hypothetical protein